MCVENGWTNNRTIFPCHIKMPRCIALKGDGARCIRNVAEEGGRCRQHHEIHTLQVQQAGPEVEGRCNVFLKRGGRWARCGREPVHDHTTCTLHTNIQERRAEQRRRGEERRRQIQQERQQRVDQLTLVYQQRVRSGTATLHQALEDITLAADRGEIQFIVRQRVIENLADLIPDVDIETARENIRILAMQILVRLHHARFHQRQNAVVVPPAPPRPVTLQEISEDRQNVHRRDVSEQTNKGTATLLKQTIPPNPRTCQMILGAWIIYGFAGEQIRDLLRIYDDMNHWYRKATCRHANDFLYKRLLDGLWVLITTRPDREVHFELVKRLYQECSEASGQCCEGHLTRLVNVMVGFDDAFQPPVSWKDVIGDKLALISRTDAPLPDKVTAATQMMNELQVPEEERRVWIEALE